MPAPWWQSAVIYQIYPRSFADANGDGIGDLPGVTSKVPYLADVLGVDAIWLSPFYPSPQKDFGYDVADHADIAPEYGTLDDFDALMATCSEHGLRVIVDFVPNHTSDQHRWFLESRASRSAGKRDWYVWADRAPDGGPPNNWLSVFGGSAWEWDAETGQYYLHSFLTSQPDLNWRNPEVRAAQHDVLRFWLDRGVSGFRIDVAHFIAKDPEMRDNPAAIADDGDGWFKELGAYDAQSHLYDKGHPDVHGFFRELRKVFDDYPDTYSIGEIHEDDPRAWVSYLGAQGDELHQVFDFSLLYAPWDASALRELLDRQEAILPEGAWPNHVLGNHDEPRFAFRRGADAARIGAMLLLTSRGTPTLYYGDELGMTQPVIPPEDQLDPWGRAGEVVGRDGCRTPMQWDGSVHGGFSAPGTASTWLPVHPDHVTRNVATQLSDEDSILNLHRRLLAARKASPALQLGDYLPLDGLPDGVLGWERISGDDRRVVLLNLATRYEFVDGVHGTIEVASTVHREHERVTGRLLLAAHEGVVVRPA